MKWVVERALCMLPLHSHSEHLSYCFCRTHWGPCALHARSGSAMSLAFYDVEDAHSRHMHVCSFRPHKIIARYNIRLHLFQPHRLSSCTCWTVSSQGPCAEERRNHFRSFAVRVRMPTHT